MSHTFTHLGQRWTLFQRTVAAGAPWYFAPRWGDRKQKVFHCLKDKTTWAAMPLAAAELAARDLITAHFRGPDQYQALRDQTKLRENLTVGKLLSDYRSAGCPDRSGNLRAGGDEDRNVEKLLIFWSATMAASISDAHRDAYRVHRRSTVRAGTGDRTTELELGTLNNALRWAWRTERLKELPRSMKATYRDPKTIAHRRFQMPSSGDEAHALAAWCFAQGAAPGPAGQFETYGWTILLAMLTGLRVGELAMLLAHPKRAGIEYPPGWMDDKYLRIHREKRGRNPKIELDDPQRSHTRPLLDAIRTWHAVRYPHHRYLLPGMGQDIALNTRALGRTIDAAAVELGIGKRCPHGLRAYYSSVRLAQGKSPDEVAKELGQSSGDELVREVYGVNPDDFDATQWTSLADRFTWLPNSANKKPAWSWWTDRDTSNIVTLNSG